MAQPRPAGRAVEENGLAVRTRLGTMHPALHARAGAEAVHPLAAVIAAVDEFNTALKDSGAWLFAGGLNPPSTAKTVDVTSGEPRVLDEPFVRADSYVGGFWVIEAPDRVGIGFAFLMGIAADLAFGSLLGEHALRLTIMAFIVQRFRAQLRFFPLSQQALAIAGLLLNDRVVGAVLHLALGEPLLPAAFWWAPLIGMLLWAPVFLLLDRLRLGGRS